MSKYDMAHVDIIDTLLTSIQIPEKNPQQIYYWKQQGFSRVE